MQKTNILFVITKLELGGAQKQLLAIIRDLDRQKFQPYLFTSREGFLVSDAQVVKGLVLFRSRFLERKINPFKDIVSFFQLRYFIKKNKIQIVHTHSSKAGILGRLAASSCKVPGIIHTVHGWSFNDFQPAWKRGLFIWLERICGDCSDKIAVVSDCDRKKGLAFNIGSPSKYQRINYGIDYGEFGQPSPDTEKELKLDPQDLAVGMVSCFKPQKSPQDFIRLARAVRERMDNVKFILVGDGILRSQIERLIKKYKLENEVLLLGWRGDIPQILSCLDVFVLTSLWEGVPIAALEAMASSLPVVATKTGGIGEIISDGKNGFLKAPGDITGLSEKLMLLLKDAELRSRMGREGKEGLGETFRLDNMQKNYYNLYTEILEHHSILYAPR
ncbi:MAG: glycosyltransferase family 4 protein [Candidatus Omnitrophica bacterium]|nr:glycosyltransferase family 4 protein [Candidatus Omnitrophota bacterium]